MKQPIFTILVFCVLCFILSCRGIPPVKDRTTPTYYPTEKWKTSTPEKQGMDSEVLSKLLDYIKKRDLSIHSLQVVRHGYLVLDAYFYPYTGETPHDVASVTKSITSSLIGLALEKGYIKSIDQPVLDFFPEYNASYRSSGKALITVRDLLTMSSGLKCGYELGEPELFAMLKSKDWAQFTLDLPMAVKPGTQFAYCSSNMHLLSAIITKTTEMSSMAFAQKHLFEPLGIKEVYWPSDPQGINHGWGDLQMHPHDMAKIGYFYLNKGEWDGSQILSPDWIARSTQKQISVAGGKMGYGYGWWVLGGEFQGMYAAVGRGGQRIFVRPEEDLVVVVTAGGLELGELSPFLVSAVKSEHALPENPDTYKRLQDRITTVKRQPAQKSISSLPAIALKISGKTYQIAANKLGIKTLSLDFSRLEEALIKISIGSLPPAEEGNYLMPIGLDDVYKFSSDGPSNLPVALKGFWQGENTFILHYNEVARINNFKISMTFENEKVMVKIDDPTGHFNETSVGKAQN